MEKENKENAYLTCPMSGACYRNMLREDLFQKVLKIFKKIKKKIVYLQCAIHPTVEKRGLSCTAIVKILNRLQYCWIKVMDIENNTKAWRTNTPCQNFKCEFYWGTNPDPYNNCRFIYLQENCCDYKN